ncbi:type II toxin-antitoxin system RelE/ParE family toxin [soil metagenome]
MIDVVRYVNSSGKAIVSEWLASLPDDRTRAKIVARFSRLTAGNFGDCKALRDGVFELRIDWGPGYRVYYAMLGRTCVLLLCGGDKRRQAADIARAVNYLKDYHQRTKES